MARIGYARVSTKEQHMDLQLKALKKAGCDPIFTDDGVSAVARHRPGFEQVMKALKPGDVFVVWKMDRAFRSVLHSAAVLEELKLYGIQLECLTEAIEIDTAIGKCNYFIRNVFAALERDLISERTLAGLEIAREKGAVLGRPRKLSDQQIREIHKRLDGERHTTKEHIAKAYGVSTRTLRRALNTVGQNLYQAKEINLHYK